MLRSSYLPQGLSIQDGQTTQNGDGSATVRGEAEGIRWTDPAYLQEEGQDDQEARAQATVLGMQEIFTALFEEDETS